MMPVWTKVLSSGALIIVGLALAVALVGGINAAFDRGAAMKDAQWEAEIAKQNAAHEKALIAARNAGREEAASATRAAEQKAQAALNALEAARNENPEFDEILRTRWPDSYFASVCDGETECLPPSGDD